MLTYHLKWKINSKLAFTLLSFHLTSYCKGYENDRNGRYNGAAWNAGTRHSSQVKIMSIHDSWKDWTCCFFRLSAVDMIITRMGAYDNMFSNASTFKVELDEWYA